MKFEYYQVTGGLLGLASGQAGWRWRLRAANNQIIASGESYANKVDCLHAIELIRGTNQLTPIVQTLT